MSNFLRNPLRTLFTAIGGSMPTANPLHRGMFGWKRATSTEDELYAGALDSSGVMQWRRLVTTTLGDSTYVNTSGDTMTGGLTIDATSDTALVVRQADDTNIFVVDTNGTTVVRVLNSALLIGYSDNGTTSNWVLSSANGNHNIFNGGDIDVYSDNGVTRKFFVDGAIGNTTVAGQMFIGSGSVEIVTGSGTPEGAVSAPVGSLFLRTDGGAGTSLYVKETGSGNTGWAGK